ncbi:mechanosensitive ion channel family protein [Viridibacterium curvum]|uniref:Small-conductance mechanosensitive channel n=1 Tax=Viridibacterium curvum TaxID=1101404 RepID=A0ABP9QCE9_9RHOO
MQTLFLLAVSATLWLLHVTIGQDASILAAQSGRLLFLAAWAITAITCVQVLQFVFTHQITGRRQGQGASDLLRAVVRIVLYLIAAGMFLHFALEQAITGILATSAMLSVIVGLALQPTLGHLFSGVSIEIERPLRVGDYIRRGEVEGQVTSLNWRSVFVTTEEGTRIVIPNSDFTSRTVEVIDGSRPFRHSAVFDMSSSVTPGKVMRIGMRVLRSGLSDVCITPEPMVVMVGTEPRSGSVRYALHFYTHNFLKREQVASDVLERLWYALSREGLQLIPPPRFGNNQGNNNAGSSVAGTRPAVDANAKPAESPGTKAPSKPEWQALIGELLPELPPTLVTRLASSAKRYRYGPHETVSPKVAALVVSGRLREALSVEEVSLPIVLEQMLQAGPNSVSKPATMPAASVNRLLRDASQAIGPLAQSLVAGYAAVTDDLWLAYQAVAVGIIDPQRRAEFLARGPEHPSRGLTRGDLLGWDRLLKLNNDPASKSLATQDCELLVWNAATLRSALGNLDETELNAFIQLLVRKQSHCRRLDLPRLQRWLARTGGLL